MDKQEPQYSVYFLLCIKEKKKKNYSTKNFSSNFFRIGVEKFSSGADFSVNSSDLFTTRNLESAVLTTDLNVLRQVSIVGV